MTIPMRRCFSRSGFEPRARELEFSRICAKKDGRAALGWGDGVAILRTLVFALLALVALAGAASADRRVAVVMGNAHYANAPPLRNPGNDATDIDAALTRLGFKVTLRLDATRRQFDQALEQFSRDAKTADAALFYYAGHGLQYQGRNYLVPVDAELRDEVSLRYETAAVEEVKEALEGSNGVKILILDSCRDNPFTERLNRSLRLSTRDIPRLQGLAREEGAKGMIIVYSTQPDEVANDGIGRNSPFSTALLKELDEPGLEVDAMFRRVENDVYRATSGAQLPELSISLAPAYYLNQSETDQTVWSRIRAGADAAALGAFIKRYPSSFYAPDARARLDLIESQERELAAAQRLRARQDALDAAAAAAKTRAQQLADQLSEAGKEEARLRDELAEEARAKEGDAARSQADKDDLAHRETALKARIVQLQAGDLEKQQALQEQLDAQRVRAATQAKAAQDATQAAEAKGQGTRRGGSGQGARKRAARAGGGSRQGARRRRPASPAGRRGAPRGASGAPAGGDRRRAAAAGGAAHPARRRADDPRSVAPARLLFRRRSRLERAGDETERRQIYALRRPGRGRE
jgi:uncharacterized caspase-like protein